ncbi:MAG: signal peptidase I [Acidobacteriota bacterium]|nr:signal peptidase I [Acidobacteriota bacterium]
MSQSSEITNVAEPSEATEPANAEKTQPNPNAPQKSVFREYLESFIVTLIMAFFGMTFIVQAVTVPTGSMQNTIYIGDHFLVNKFIYGPGTPLPFLPMREVRRGDIVVFKYPGNRVNPAMDRSRDLKPYEINYIKRVIGLPGDTVEFRDNRVYINGQLLPERRLIGDTVAERGRNPDKVSLTVKEFEPDPPDATYTVYYETDTVEAEKKGISVVEGRGMNFGVAGKPSIVPPDHYFMMGDARDNSEDSRYWGFVHRDLIIGRAMFIYWSCDQSQNDSFIGCLTSPRFNRIGTLIK